MPTGRVLAAGGSIHEGSLLGNVQTDSAEIYDPASGRWTLTGPLSTRRTSARAATLDDGRVLVAGGNLYDVVGNGINLSIVDREVLSTTEIWDPATGVWLSGGSMSQTRTGFVLVKLLNGALLAAGGNGLSGAELQCRPVQLIYGIDASGVIGKPGVAAAFGFLAALASRAGVVPGEVMAAPGVP